MIRFKIIVNVVTVLLAGISLKAQKSEKYFLFIGGYTKPVADKGIAVYEFDAKNGSLLFRSVVGDVENPSYLTVSPDGKNVYAVCEAGKQHGKVAAYTFDATTATLKFILEVSSGGRGPCYISTDKNRKHLLVANYNDGTITSIAVDKNGLPDSARTQAIPHTGNSIDKANQAGPHGHSVIVSPDQRFALSADLGSDRIYIYKYDANKAMPLTEASPAFVSVTPGSGPRHICFHPKGNYVYAVNELNGSVDAFSYNNGVLKHLQNSTMLPEGFHGVIEAADIHISPDGKFLYASNREERNEIAVYSIGKKGQLSFIARQSVLGAAPRNFAIDPTGRYLLCANMNSNEIVVFMRDSKTGLLKPTGTTINSSAPSCLKFYKMK